MGGGRRVAPGASLGCAQAPRGSRLDSTAERPHTGEAPWQGGEAPRRGQLPAGARVQGRSPWYAAQGTVNTVTQKRILREHTSGTVWVQPPPLEKTTLGAGTRKMALCTGTQGSVRGEGRVEWARGDGDVSERKVHRHDLVTLDTIRLMAAPPAGSFG